VSRMQNVVKSIPKTEHILIQIRKSRSSTPRNWYSSLGYASFVLTLGS